MRLLFGISITDIDCGFKLFRRDLLDGMELHAGGAMVTTELLARLANRGARICEVDVKHLPRLSGEQSGNSPKVILRAFRELFQLYADLKQDTGSGRKMPSDIFDERIEARATGSDKACRQSVVPEKGDYPS
jgi:hypothetical protein